MTATNILNVRRVLDLENLENCDVQNIGHNTNMPVSPKCHKQSAPIQNFSAIDPLDKIDKIEIVQQSDTYTPEEDEDTHNLSALSLNSPIKDLLGAFNQMSEDKPKNVGKSIKVSKDSCEGSMKNSYGCSPSGVENFIEDPSSTSRDEEFDNKSQDEIKSVKSQSQYINKQGLRLQFPKYELHAKLKLDLSQPVIDRCSFYSVIHGVNKAVQEMAAEDQNGNFEETKDEESALVLAVNGPAKVFSKREGPQVELAVLDEEKFLLAAIESRKEDEILIRACPATFAEAIGEEDLVPNSHSENPLSVLSSSRTQLWKPSRSWWEAKSGKNPWIEPNLHNKRWRYLWQLIYYHKFLAKCIKKLKRNNVDVKTSMSPVAAFLREEVCAVSDHLASVSKFTSQDWMEGLPHFNGWTSQDPKDENVLNSIIKQIPMRSLSEPSDVESSLLRDQIDICFLKSMQAAREQMNSGGQQSTRSVEEQSVHSDYSSQKSYARSAQIQNQSFTSMQSSSRPPRYGGNRGIRPIRNNYGNRVHPKQYRNPRHNSMYGAYSHPDPSMIPQQQMFQPSYSYGNGYGGQYMHPSVNGSFCGWNPYGGNDLSMSMSGDSYLVNPYDRRMENESFYRCDDSVTNVSIAEAPQYPNHVPVHNLTHGSEGYEGNIVSFDGRQVSVPVSANASFDETSSNGIVANDSMKTPCKARSDAIPATPPSSCAHLFRGMPGLVTPVSHAPSHRMVDTSSNYVEAKPLLINNNYNHYFGQGGRVPCSPATQFQMSAQANAQANPYFTHAAYPQHQPPMMAHYCGPMAPYPQSLNADEASQHNTQPLTEGTRTETSSDTGN
mmetsp:Transcript_33428/g.38915  ORF Transcript_33428/g.38915 Transcript_33428/m.38915 type:complete len:833 (+) Transcript_33428:334-2832(+)